MGAVLVFVPQIFILFLNCPPEDSGYLARAASIIDRPFTAVGLNGRALFRAIRICLCRACHYGLSNHWIAHSKIDHHDDYSFLTCSARLPVFALLLTFYLRDPRLEGGLAMTALYMGSLIIGAPAAVLSRFIKTRILRDLC